MRACIYKSFPLKVFSSLGDQKDRSSVSEGIIPGPLSWATQKRIKLKQKRIEPGRLKSHNSGPQFPHRETCAVIECSVNTCWMKSISITLPFLSGKQTVFIEHVSFCHYRHDAFLGIGDQIENTRNLNLLALQGDGQPSLYTWSQVREQRDPSSSEPHCLSELSRTQSWSQKAIHGIGCQRVSYACDDECLWWPGGSSWPPSQKDPSPWPEAANHWPGTQSTSLACNDAGPSSEPRGARVILVWEGEIIPPVSLG